MTVEKPSPKRWIILIAYMLLTLAVEGQWLALAPVARPVLVVADRSNRRLQNFTLDGQHINFITDELRSPCHFHTSGDLMVIPDLESRVTLFDKNNKLVAQLGDGGSYKGLRELTRDHFTPGKFVAPHSAYFDRAGNIFIVEWVEVGRVTKLRKIA